MKYLFMVIVLVLIAASIGTSLSMPEAKSKVPIIYWVTDANPARNEQIRLFHEWLVAHGHVTKDGQPICELRLDTANRDTTKQKIQGVSGVAGDVMDIGGGMGLQDFNAIGLLSDVTDAGVKLGFAPSKTYATIESEITIDGRQYLFPCNVNANMYWVSRKAFERVGQPLPPLRWTLDEFEARGKAYVEAANKDLPYQRYFFAGNANRVVMMRSLGLDMFNETMSASALDDPRYVETLTRIYKWTYVDHIIPTSAEMASFTTDTGYGGAQAQLLQTGNIAMMETGRYMLIQFRRFAEEQNQPPMALSVAELPHAGFPNAQIGTRAAGVYAGSPNKDLAHLFLSYLASETYNMQIVRDADALPPDPQYTHNDEYLRPGAWQNEWGMHEEFATIAETIAIGGSNSPFVLTTTANRKEKDAYDEFMNNRMSAEAAARSAAKWINDEILRTVAEDQALEEPYEKAVELQKQIEAYRAANRKVPLAWLRNPFHRRYYQAMGWCE